MSMKKNLDEATVKGFGQEWQQFNQANLSESERLECFQDYMHLFPWDQLPSDGGIGLDAGCGSGRWAKLVLPRVKKLYLLDASIEALSVAKSNLKDYSNAEFINASIGFDMLPDNSLDFAYSLGVLHHLPDTKLAMTAIAKTLKKGAPFLVYLYYNFENRPKHYQYLWKITDYFRKIISCPPFLLRKILSDIIACTVYWPLSRLALLLEKIKRLPASWPLAYYRNKSFYTLRTDALDRFGTRLEQRFSRAEIRTMLEKAGFENITFSDKPPYWCALAFKK